MVLVRMAMFVYRQRGKKAVGNNNAIIIKNKNKYVYIMYHMVVWIGCLRKCMTVFLC